MTKLFQEIEDSPGIYAIQGPSATYVGKSNAVRTRLMEHRSRLERNAFGYDQLQTDWRQLGETAFRFEVLEYVTDTAPLLEREKFHLHYQQRLAPDRLVVGDRKNGRKSNADAKPGEYGVPGKRATVSRQIWDLCDSLPHPHTAGQVVGIILERGITKSAGNARQEYNNWRKSRLIARQ